MTSLRESLMSLEQECEDTHSETSATAVNDQPEQNQGISVNEHLLTSILPVRLPPQPTGISGDIPILIDLQPLHENRNTTEDNKTRVEAITLIRARTITRQSPTETASTDQPRLFGDPSVQLTSKNSASRKRKKPKNKKNKTTTTKRKKKKKQSENPQTVKESDSIPTDNKDPSLNLTDTAVEEANMSPLLNNEQIVPEFLSFPPLKQNSTTLTTSTPSTNVASEDQSSTYASVTKGPPRETQKPTPEQESEPQHKDEALKENVEQKPVADASQARSDPPAAHFMRGSLDAFLVPGRSNKRKKKKGKPANNRALPTTPVKNKLIGKGHEKDKVISDSVSHAVPSSTQPLPATSPPPPPPPPPRSNKNSHKGSTPMKEKLPPIREVSPDHANPENQSDLCLDHSEQDPLPMDNQSLADTPKSTSTNLTAWVNVARQDTPQTEVSDDLESDRTVVCNKLQNMFINTQPRPMLPPTTGTTTSHAHPQSTPEPSQDHHGPPRTNTVGPQPTPKPDGWFWQLDSHGFPCAKADCEKRCNCWDGATVICPACGPFSEVRYCNKKHLLEDIKKHWVYCGQLSFRHPCRETSIPRSVRDGPPLVPCLHPYDTPERHRQAVYFNSHNKPTDGDYFIFSDWVDFAKAGFPENKVNVRCSNKVVYIVKFEDPKEKDRFRRVLATCLFMTISVTELVDYLFRLIRDKLRSPGIPRDLEVALKYQIHEETAVTIQPHITGERHACETDWSGKNRRHCQDALCRSEYRPLLGKNGGNGHSHLIDHFEGRYWILRAARTTHPDVKNVHARTKGEGFEDVAEEDKREFWRGEGWDGFDTGDMEIEGINDE
ncbi:hypothetical protein FE257_009363 [Aspergillus nanangensis]|uniref:Uncharacterized protein n=1 Tax=Aspergillus nanangensis TaxID=2582783 RepID=A0AAD4CK16_ASPNN|nr:hypothetical protein FE257_009363 [Aspergillus nanangensis]